MHSGLRDASPLFGVPTSALEQQRSVISSQITLGTAWSPKMCAQVWMVRESGEVDKKSGTVY